MSESRSPVSPHRPGLLALALLLVLPVLPAAPETASAQSVFSTGGLGVPIHARDARTHAMGGVRVGLVGPALFPGDPGVALDLLLPVVAATYQGVSGSFSEPAGEGDLEGARFPFVGIAYPFGGRGLLTLTFEGVLDQRWEVVRDDVIMIGSDLVPVSDAFRSDGGVSALRIGWNHRFSDEFAALVSVGAYTGRSDRGFVRRFPDGVDGDPVAEFRRESSWGYSGPTAEVGAVWDATDFVRVGGRVTWSGTVTVDPDDDTPGGEREFDFPLAVDLGVSGVLTSRLVGAVGIHYTDWSDAGAALDEGGSVGGTWEIGGGVEWAGPRFIGREFPLRLGYRTLDLPFLVAGAEAEESALTFGVGAALAQVNEEPLARLDLAVERGGREGGGLEEDFWRATVSLRLSTP